MKNIIALLFTVFSISPLIIIAQSTSPKDAIIKEHKVYKLVLKNTDKTDHLARVKITSDKWVEYDKSGKEIGTADIKKFNSKMIKIKWTSATNGADVGDYTIYKYKVLEDKILFSIYFEGEEQGYFECSK